MNPFFSVMQLLSNREEFIQEVLDDKQLNSKISSLMLSSFVFFAIYGLIIGSFHSWQGLRKPCRS